MMARRRPILTALLARSANSGYLFDGQRILVTMVDAIPTDSTGTPRAWVRLFKDRRVGSWWEGTLYRQWGSATEPVLVEPPTIVNGKMRARVIPALASSASPFALSRPVVITK